MDLAVVGLAFEPSSDGGDLGRGTGGLGDLGTLDGRRARRRRRPRADRLAAPASAVLRTLCRWPVRAESPAGLVSTGVEVVDLRCRPRWHSRGGAGVHQLPPGDRG